MCPTEAHQRRSVESANAEVSWSRPTDTQPVLAATSYTPYGIALPPGSPGDQRDPATPELSSLCACRSSRCGHSEAALRATASALTATPRA